MGSNTSKTIMPASTKSPLPETEEEIFNEKSYSLTSTFDNFREQFEGLELENAENEINQSPKTSYLNGKMISNPRQRIF